MKKLAFFLVWIVCGYGGWGLTLGYFSNRFPDQSHVATAGVIAAAGPFGLLASLAMCDPIHWRVVPMTPEERWEAFHRSAPELSREYFEQHYN